ncbi:MAG: nucleotidyltransferase domain-containing protein [Anaerolineae bacterium]
MASREEVDWGAFQRIARENDLAPLLYYTLRGTTIVPPTIHEALQDAYYYVAGQNSIRLHEMDRILAALAEERVPVLLLKGAAFVETVYGNPGLRPMVDIDLLVDRVAAAERALVKAGYEMSTADPWPGFSWRYRNSVAYSRLSGRGLPWLVGLHVRLFDVPYYERIPMDEWFARGIAAPGLGHGACVPAPEDHLVYLCGHLALHHQYDPTLLRFVDIALLIQRTGDNLDWDQVVDRGVAWRLVIPLQRVITRLEGLWPGTLPPDVVTRIAQLRPTGSERRVHQWVTAHPRSPMADTILALTTMPGFGRRLRFLLEVGFPSPDYMSRRYCSDRPGLWPFAYLRRAGLAIGYLFRGAR